MDFEKKIKYGDVPAITCLRTGSSGSHEQSSAHPYKKKNSVAIVRKRTIPTERPPLVGQPLQVEGVASSAQRIPTAVNLGFLDRSHYFFIEVAPQLSSQG
jgi:hypothetical protein